MKAKDTNLGRYRHSQLMRMGIAERAELHLETPIGDLVVDGKCVWTSEQSRSTLGYTKYLVEAAFSFNDGSSGCFSIIRNEDRSFPASHLLMLDFAKRGRPVKGRLVGLESKAASGIGGPLSVVELAQTRRGLSIAGLRAEENPLVTTMICLSEASQFHVQFIDANDRRDAIVLPLGESGKRGFDRFMKAENRAYVAGVLFGYEHASAPLRTAGEQQQLPEAHP